MTDGAGLGAGLWMDQMPVLYGARDLISQGIHPGATGRNLQHFGPRIRWAENLNEFAPKLLADPQTSGGMLLAVSPDRVSALCDNWRPEDAWPNRRGSIGGGLRIGCSP